MREEQERIARQAFKQMNRSLMVPLWRLGLGRLINIWPDGFGQIMVLTHTGRKSGRMYHTPLNYAIVGQDVYAVAGFGEASDWYRNIRANPGVEVWLPHGWWRGTAEDADDAPNRLAIVRKVLIASGFAARLLEGVDPRTMSDEALADLTGSYRLIRVRRCAERTGPGGPDEFAWVWPLAFFALLTWRCLRPRRR